MKYRIQIYFEIKRTRKKNILQCKGEPMINQRLNPNTNKTKGREGWERKVSER